MTISTIWIGTFIKKRRIHLLSSKKKNQRKKKKSPENKNQPKKIDSKIKMSGKYFCFFFFLVDLEVKSEIKKKKVEVKKIILTKWDSLNES